MNFLAEWRSLCKYSFLSVFPFVIGVVLAKGPVAQGPQKMSSPPRVCLVGKDFQHWNAERAMPLQPHQCIPIDYLEKNPGIKGLLINHGVGTGKTYLALGFCERNPSRKVVILVPGFLKAHWLEHIDKYAVKNKERYRIISYDDIESLGREDLSDKIVVLDESHRFIRLTRSQVSSEVYKQLYFDTRKAHRILSLTATPIYSDTVDLLYQINLVSGREELPFNNGTFRTKYYSRVDRWRSFWRGYLSEGYVTFPPLGSVLLSPIMGLARPALKWLLPVQYDDNPLRSFDTRGFSTIASKYISYYIPPLRAEYYPTQSSQEVQVAYNQAQLTFLLKFYESELDYVELRQLLKDSEGGLDWSPESVTLNSSAVQDSLKTSHGAGREIGNLLFVERSNVEENKGLVMPTQEIGSSIIYPPKFKRLLSKIEESKRPVVVYSHYYYNGLLLFKQFLDLLGYQGKYSVLHPYLSTEEHACVIREFNEGRKKILLLHPDITEGISLKGTGQFHFLEMPVSQAVRQQITGRAIRYRSHMHLPENERHVSVYIWCNTFPLFDTNSWTYPRRNWSQKFSEVGYYSGDRSQVDKAAHLKVASPDMRAYSLMNATSVQTVEFRNYARQFCIESFFYHEPK